MAPPWPWLWFGGGWTLESLPGTPPALHRGADRVEPFRVVEEFADGKLTEQGWQERAAALGIANLRLSVT